MNQYCKHSSPGGLLGHLVVLVEENRLRSTIARLLLVLLVCLFLLQRIGLLLYGYPHIAHPTFDETASGVLTCDLLNGAIRAPLSVYQYESRSGDSLLEGLLLAPFFVLFGRSLLSLKLLALASSLFSLLCWTALLRRYHGAWASLIFAALFAFPPPAFSRLTLLGTVASHHLINPLMALQLLLLFLIIEDSRGRISPWLWAGMGALAGLGAYTFYTHIIFNLFCGLTLLLFRPQLISVRALLLSAGGFLTGFAPWIAMALTSGGGGGYLLSILRDIRFDGGVLARNFFFTIPHSLGYAYPSPEIGTVSILFSFFILVLAGRLAVNFFRQLSSLRAAAPAAALRRLNPSSLLSILLVMYPPFFLLLISLSPLEIKPFEYWPAVSFFGQFSVADLYRYRWLTPLYPCTLALIAAGMAGIAGTSRVKPFIRYAAGVSLVFFLTCGAVKSVSFCSGSQFLKICSYKGFSYDQMGNRFMLRPGDAFNEEQAMRFIADYPEENRSELYKFLGARVMMRTAAHTGAAGELEGFLQPLEPAQRENALYGIIWAAQNIPDDVFQPLALSLADTLNGLYYETWGYRYLAYRYYLVLLNREAITACLSPGERWFFRKFLRNFEGAMLGRAGEQLEGEFLREIESIPPEYQAYTVRGIGMRVGDEMLFNPVGIADYPLDSRYGRRFEHSLQEAFYEGVGAGFAEALCRLWRTLLLPDDHTSPLYRERLDLEWNRCQSLMTHVSPARAELIRYGFFRRLDQLQASPGMVSYLRNAQMRAKNKRGRP
jgi:hypothetical protein